jgi:hypothetical protein
MEVVAGFCTKLGDIGKDDGGKLATKGTPIPLLKLVTGAAPDLG